MIWLGLAAFVCLAIAGCHAGYDACATGPCQSGGTCTASASSYSCTCPAGYTGANCQFQDCNLWSNSISSGVTSESAAGLDGSQRWTMIQKEGFFTGGTLIGFKFYAKKVSGVTLGIYRPTGGVCSFTLVALFSPAFRETGLITFELPQDQQIRVQQNDTVGLTWTNTGVVPYDTVTPYLFCDDNQSPPGVGGVITLKEKSLGQRAYSIQAMIVPTAPILPGPYLGFGPFSRSAVPSALLWTMVQTRGFPLAGTLTGFEFYVQAVKPVQLGLYRPVAGCTFTLLKSWSPAVSAVGLVRVSFTGSDVAQFQAGDTIGLSWTNYGQIPYDLADDFNYCDDAVGQPAVGSVLRLSAGKNGNRFYSMRAVVQFKLSDSCSSNPCQNGGACCNSGDSYYCQCPPGTVQPNCAKATNCLQSPCINGGTCVTVTKTSYSCTCLPGYSGTNCETRPCDNSVMQSIGFTPVYRGGLDGGLRTIVQSKGFPTAGVMTGYRFYAQIIRNLQVGLYRPMGSCRYQLVKSWTRAVVNEGVQTVEFSLSEQANFQAGDTIGFTGANGGVVPYNDYNGINYCSDAQAQPAVGATIALGGPTQGNRIYSFEALYISNGPGPVPSFLGFSIIPGSIDGSAINTYIQIRGFQVAGTLIGFKFQVGAVRPLQLGLYRPVPGTCTYQLLKGWTPNLNSLGQMDVYFTTSDRANFQVGDTFGFSWSNGGVIPYDGSSDFNYCENNVAQPAVGTTVTLVPGRYGNRFYSIHALFVPASSTTTCLAPTGCSPNPCQNGGLCDADDSAGFVCTCQEGYGGDNCEIPPASEPCSVSFNTSTSQWIGYQAFDRVVVDGATVYTFVQSKGFPSAGILTGFQFFAKYVRPLTLGLYRQVNGCTFKLLKSFAPKIVSVGVFTYQLSRGDQISFQAGDTIGFSWTNGGVITYDSASANDYLYCENNVGTPSVGTTFTLVAGRYGNRLYSIRALYTPTSIAPQPLSLGWNTVNRGGADGSIVWTFVQIDGFQTDGTLQGFQFYVSDIHPLTLGLYRPIGGTCSYVLLKVYTPPVVNTGVNTFTLSPSDQYRFQAGDTIGLTWTNTGVVSFEAATGYLYCEDKQAVTTEGATVTLISKRYGNRFYSFQALYRPVTSTGNYVDYCAATPCQNGGTCCSTTTAFECTCPPNTIAPNCAPSDPCKSSPCANGGDCKKISETAYSCACQVGYDGDDCDQVVPNPCDNKPCKNGGTCTRLDNTNFACQCTSKYIGSTCQTAIQPCSSSPCKNGGICSGSGSSYTCNCPVGYSGSTCNTVVPDPCVLKPCSNGGVCTRLDNTQYSCQCSSSYTGTNCETALPCASSPCQHGGTCTNSGTTDYDCNCPDDYNDGDTCSTYQDLCLSGPCLHGGTCTRQTWNTYTCTCPTGWVGQRCELNPAIAPCDNLPCQNSGTCTNGDGLSYTCKCPLMWDGPSCNTVHCLSDSAQCNSTTPSLSGRFAYCSNCAQFVACRKKRQRIATCSLYPSFDRTLRKCTNNTAVACAGL